MLAYQGDPETGEPPDGSAHAVDLQFQNDHHIWDVGKVKALVADKSHEMSFFCGGSRNFRHFIHLFDKVFVLDVDVETLKQRLDGRRDEWGSTPSERAMVLRLHETKANLSRCG